MSGGPAEHNGTYAVKYWIQGGNIAGASPLASAPGETSSGNRTLRFNITAPSQEGSFDLVMDASSRNSTLNTTIKRTITIEVLPPLILTASFRNGGGATAVNVTVRFYVDNRLAGSKVVSRIDPGERATATMNWIPVGVRPGQHQVRVEADLDGDGVINPSKGEVIAYDVFYKSGEELATGYLVLIAFAIVVVGMIILFTYRRRMKTR